MYSISYSKGRDDYFISTLPLYGGKGYVSLVDHMGSDESVIEAARTSFGHKKSTRISRDQDLIRYLMKNKHLGPFEFGSLVFEFKIPIHVARQIMRYRTASINEISGRYVELPRDEFIPKKFYGPADNVKQGRSKIATKNQKYIRDKVVDIHKYSRKTYDDLISGKTPKNKLLDFLGLKKYAEADRQQNKVSKEQARGVLSLDTYTVLRFKINVRNFFGIMTQRLDSHAQEEVRELVTAMFNLFENISNRQNQDPKYLPKKKPSWLYTCEAFRSCSLEGLELSKETKSILYNIIQDHVPPDEIIKAIEAYKGNMGRGEVKDIYNFLKINP